MNVKHTSLRARPSRPLTFLASLALVIATLAVVSGAASGNDGQTTSSPGIAATVTDLANSANAAVLVDGAHQLGSAAAWEHSGNPWQESGYPWMAVVDLGEQHDVESLRYFSGPVPWPAEAALKIEGSNDNSMFVPVATATAPRYDRWNTVGLSGDYRYLRLSFNGVHHQFAVTEIQVTGSPTGGGGSGSGGGGGTGGGTDGGTDGGGTGGGTGGGGNGGNGSFGWDPDTNLQAGVPTDAEQAHMYEMWPKEHLSPACQELHDRYWTRGPSADPTVDPATRPGDPEYLAYHTWHPAVTNHPDTGERCDFGHEHGHDPSSAEPHVFELFGGWPAFGYAAAKNAAAGDSGPNPGDPRHEDHVGHKVTVATFGAAFGNGANTDITLYPAGFECHWLSKIHQGSWSMDAYKNHIHEYFLALSCDDGPNGEIGTELSVKFLYTFGNPNEFNPKGCQPDPQSSANVVDPAGNAIGLTTNVDPLPNDTLNSRGLGCWAKLGWQPADQLGDVDLWTQPIGIERDGDRKVFLQPYYIVKNPARILETPTKVAYTLDLCKNPATYHSGYCTDDVATIPNWDSPGTPYNGALRALNFKKVALYNGGGATNWCTNAFGRGGATSASGCGNAQIEQYVSSFDNRWDGRTNPQTGRSGQVSGAWWTRDPWGNVNQAPTQGDGYRAFGLGFEYVVDNRNPDDNFDGTPDGATLRGRN